MTDHKDPRAIRVWMKANVRHHRDSITREVNTTSLVEAWDSEFGNSEETLDSNHPAWEIAGEVAAWAEHVVSKVRGAK